MNAGLPGTGLGGMLYMLLALWMIVVELHAIACDRTRRAQWHTVIPLSGVAVGMLAMIWLTLWVYTALLPPSYLALPHLYGLGADHPSGAMLLGAIGMGTAIAILTLLMLGIQVARWCCRARVRRGAGVPVSD